MTITCPDGTTETIDAPKSGASGCSSVGLSALLPLGLLLFRSRRRRA